MGSLSQIKHVVVVMFENRSFDNMLGWLYPSGEAQPSQFLPGTNGAPFEGLKPELWNPSNESYFSGAPPDKVPISSSAPGMTTPDVEREANDESFYPQLPFVIAISANWLKVPERAPETKMMVRNTHYDDDGEEVGDSPEVVFYFDELRTRKLEEDLREFEARLRLIDKYQPEWRFVYTALGFLAKAFQTRGLEQLLWDITAIEAVLGQNREGLTKILNRRIVEVFGRSPDGKKRLKKQFDDLYGFRSDLVHGNTKLDDRKIMKGHLAESRDFARGVVAWATGLLACVARNYTTGGQRIPTRDDLLLVLDMETTTRSSIAALLQVLPSKFPAVETWLAYGKSAGFPWES